MSRSFIIAVSGGSGSSFSSVMRPRQYLVSNFAPTVNAKTGTNPPSTAVMNAGAWQGNRGAGSQTRAVGVVHSH